MDGIQEWGYDVIEWTQQFSPALDTSFKAVTTLGAEQAFLLLLPLIYWCMDKRRGARLGLLLILSALLNTALKELFSQPRPSPDRVKVMAEESSPGLPSGHSQNAVAVYGFLAAQLRQPHTWAPAGLAAFSVGLSRVYLGVHFPSDVLGGWLAGVVLLTLYLRVEPKVEFRLRTWPWETKIVLAIALPLILFFIYSNENSAQLLGVSLGLMTGVFIEGRWVKFSVEGPLPQRVLRFFVGGVVLVVVWLGSKALLPSEPEGALILRLVRYTLVGAWTSLGAPWLFVGAGLAPRERDAQS
jgi:membrane-associated phospholipid phosphatase